MLYIEQQNINIKSISFCNHGAGSMTQISGITLVSPKGGNSEAVRGVRGLLASHWA
jgi:hypothetical protein